MRSTRRRAFTVGVAVTLLTVSCDTQRIIEAIEDLWSSVTPSNAVIRAIGATVQLAVVDESGAPVTVPGLSWRSAQPAVVQVDATGRAIAVAPGTAQVIAETESHADTANIDVRQDVASVTVTPPASSIGIGAQQALTATLRDPNAHPISGRAVTWTSSAPGVATVNAGVVTGVSAGSTTITATSEGISGTATVNVEAAPPPPPPPPPPVATVEVNPSSASVVAGQTRQLSVTLRDAGGNVLTGRIVTWATNASGVATVSGTGLVTAQNPGSATITATSEGVSGTSAITVTPAPVASVTVTPASPTIEVPNTRQLTATLRDAAGNQLTGRTITWSSSATGIATVSSTGLVTAVAEGSATITATSEGISGNASVTVTAAPAPDQTPPSIPQNLVGLAVGPTQVNLSWSASTDNVGVTGYRVFRNGTQVGTPTAPAFQDVNASASTTYSYTVAAVDAAGNVSAQSNSVSVTTPAPGSTGSALPARLAQSTGTVFYVAPNGSNTNPGTLAAPWQTIQKALNTLQPGQKAYVRAGTYREALSMDRAGTASAPITIEAYPGERPIVDAELVRRPLVIESGAAYFRIKGFILDRDCCTSGGHIDVYGHHIEIIDNEMRNGKGKGVYTDEVSHHVHIIGNWMHHNWTSGGQQDHGIYLQGDDHFVANNVIHDHPDGFGIQIYDKGSRHIVVNNTVTNNGHSGIVVGGSGGVSHVTIRNNILANNDSYGVQHDSSCPISNVLVENNVIFGNGSGMVQGGCSSISASGNINANPLFVNAASRDLRVQAGSPAINAARVDFASPTTFGGLTRDAQPDIGAHEFGVTP
jgi:uncharacterized protein YjdB